MKNKQAVPLYAASGGKKVSVPPSACACGCGEYEAECRRGSVPAPRRRTPEEFRDAQERINRALAEARAAVAKVRSAHCYCGDHMGGSGPVVRCDFCAGLRVPS